MKLIFHIRPLKFFLIRNWYGRRSGEKWGIDGNKAYMLDIGALTLGVEVKKRMHK